MTPWSRKKMQLPSLLEDDQGRHTTEVWLRVIQLTVASSSHEKKGNELNQLTSVFHASVIDHEFRHNIVKVADHFDNVMTKFVVNNGTDALKTDIILLFTNYKFMCLSAYWQYKLTN